jgi:tetratricopeptide (TPR) repeat protein
MRNSLHVIASLCLAVSTMGLAERCPAMEYPLGQLSLWKPLRNDVSANSKCSSRAEFSDTTQCSLSGPSAARATNISDILIESSSRKVLYAYGKSYEPDSLGRVESRAISEISNTLGGLTPRRFPIDSAVVAVWGDVKLEKIAPSTKEYDEIEGFVEQRYGLLVEVSGDFKASKDAGRPIYRIIGGDGLLLILSQNRPNRTVVQRLIVAAGSLAEKNFKSQADQFLAKDRAALPADYSGWPEIAFMIRRLALNTTVENANRVVDEVFSGAPSQKYRSHVWAFLPTSVINHLKDRAYTATDVFNEKTEFPNIRDRIIAQLNTNPAEPFSDFLLYTLGRFDDAIQFNQKSPVRTVLIYASAHSKLRKVTSDLFQMISKAGDRELLLAQIFPKSYLDEIDPENSLFQDTASASKSENRNYIELKKVVDESDRKRELRYKEKTPGEKNIELAKRDFFNDYAYATISHSNDDYRDNEPSLSQYLNYINKFPERYDSRPIALKFPEFTAQTDRLLPLFNEVLKDRSSPHFDDAVYFLGWLAYHRGNVDDALNKFESAISLLPAIGSPDGDYVDYAEIAVHQTSRILRTLAPEDALNRVQNSKVLSSRPGLWYTALAELYHSGKHRQVMDGARRALREFGVTIENLPITTDPSRITDAFGKLQLADDSDLEEIAYLYQASREAEQLEAVLSNVDKQPPLSSATEIKRIVVKYSLTRDPDEKKPPQQGPKPLHRDLRQSLYLVQRALDLLPRNTNFSKLREWLHYKRVALLAQFDPTKVAAANARFQEEFPASTLLDDTMAEQVFAEAIVVGDMVKATATFNTLRQKYTTANAIDNAYSWMAIGWTCAGQPVKARELDQEIVRRFPSTRHALFARKRLREPQACSGLEELYLWDYRAMGWRERNRIDTIHDALKVLQR